MDQGKAVSLYHLEYFTNPIHFAGHYVAIIGYDEEKTYLVDTAQQGGEVSTSLESLELARSEKGSMSSKNFFIPWIENLSLFPLKTAVLTAIRNNAVAYMDPPMKNLSYKGIDKASHTIVDWFDNSKRRFWNNCNVDGESRNKGAILEISIVIFWKNPMT